MKPRKTSLIAGCCAALCLGTLAHAAGSELTTSKLLFVAVQGSGSQIFSINSDGTEQKALTTGPGENYQPAWSPDGRKIVFASTRDGAAASSIYVMDADGSNLKRLTHEALPDSVPTWSPDGKHIVFRSHRDRRSAFYSMDADGGNVKRLTDAVSDKGAPRFSPDGRYIAYEVYGDLGVVELHVMKSDGSDDKDVTSQIPKDKKTQPSWAPDGSRLAFVSVKSYGENYIYTVKPDGSGLVNLTPVEYMSTQPSWSPDGKQIAFVSNRYGDMMSRSAGDIYLMNADGSGTVNLTRHPASDVNPVWSGDGRTLYFLSMRDGPPHLYALDLEGGAPRRVTQHEGQDLGFSVGPTLAANSKTKVAGTAPVGAGAQGN